jgi:DNA replication and repair protein RecF
LPYWAETTASLLDLNVKLTYYRGWAQERTLAESLAKHLDSDRERQTTGLGAHRFDIVLTCDHKAARDVLSRGQQKLLGSAMTLAMAKLVWAENRQPTVLLLDDPAAELDRTHTQELVREIRTLKGQMVITALDAASSLLMGPGRVFHVEQGRVTTG